MSPDRITDPARPRQPGAWPRDQDRPRGERYARQGDEQWLLTVTVGLEACPTQVANVFILGSATRGILGTNRLGKQGLDDPSTVFILGSSLLGTGLLGH